MRSTRQAREIVAATIILAAGSAFIDYRISGSTRTKWVRESKAYIDKNNETPFETLDRMEKEIEELHKVIKKHHPEEIEGLDKSLDPPKEDP